MAFFRRRTDGTLSFSDGYSTIEIPFGYHVNNLRPITRADLVQPKSSTNPNGFTVEDDKRRYGSKNLSLSGNLTFNLFENGRFRIGGRYVDGEFENTPSLTRVPLPRRLSA